MAPKAVKLKERLTREQAEEQHITYELTKVTVSQTSVSLSSDDVNSVSSREGKVIMALETSKHPCPFAIHLPLKMQ